MQEVSREGGDSRKAAHRLEKFNCSKTERKLESSCGWAGSGQRMALTEWCLRYGGGMKRGERTGGEKGVCGRKSAEAESQSNRVALYVLKATFILGELFI